MELLFVRTPDTTWHEDQHNYIQELADKNNIKFLDLNLKSNMDKMQFDYSEDAADTVHVNILGAKKITKFVGQYIADNYKLTDYRKTDNSIKKDFESQKSNYQAALNEGKLSLITNFDEYLKAINTDEYSVIITSGSNVRNITFTDSQKKTLISMGADEALFTDSTYGNNVICVLDGDNSKNKVKKQLEDNSKVTTLGGTLTCGTDYDITANSKGGTMRLNNSKYTGLISWGMNIIVYDKKLKEVADTAFLHFENNATVMHTEESSKMGFNTLSFIPFLLIVILLYFTIFRKCQWVFLLLASIAFYLFAGPKYIIFILFHHLAHIHWQERFRSYTTMKAELQRQESFLQRKLRRLLRKDLLREEKEFYFLTLQ